jgi:LysM repeat protein
VKRTSYFNIRILLVLTAVMLLLVACERPLQPDLEDAPAVPPVQVDPAPSQPEALPPPGTEPSEGEQPPTSEEPITPGQEPGEQPGQPAEPPPSSETPGSSEPVTYVVQGGDTLFRISQRYNVSIEDIVTANNLQNPNRLDIGQTLIIPVGGLPSQPGQPATGEIIHTVQAGENLFRIGLRYGFTVDALVTYNNIANPNRLDVGQQIRIPPSD